MDIPIEAIGAVWAKGRAAALSGRALDEANEYPVGSAHHAAWLAGYMGLTRTHGGEGVGVSHQ